MGFPLLLNKALAGVKKHGLDLCKRWTLLGHVQSGQVGFPLLLNKALAGVKKHGLDGGLCKRGACSEWVSGLSLAAEQSIDVRSRNMDMGVLQAALF